MKGPTSEAARADSLDELIAHLQAVMRGARGTAGYGEAEQHLDEVVNLGWRAVVGSAEARGDGRATLRAAHAAVAKLVADGSFKAARAATVYVFGACDFWRPEIDAAVAVVRQAGVPGAEIFGWSIHDSKMGDEVEVTVILFAFVDEMAAVSSGADS